LRQQSLVAPSLAAIIMRPYIALFIVAIISFTSICTLEMYPKNDINYDESLDNVRLFLPAFVFSIFILIYQLKYISLLKSVLLFASLIIVYSINLIISFSSWGLAVPIAGGIGGAMIGFVIKFNHKKPKTFYDEFIVLGFVSALFGLIFYYTTSDHFVDGIGFGVIIVLWQISVGSEVIGQAKKIPLTIKS
jgi:hypothetical protein